MKIILTNLPSFYKINLYNRIAEHIKLLVVFTGRDGETRNADFLKGEIKFDTIFLKGSEWQKALQFRKIIKDNDYIELIIAGWDNLSSWVGAFCSSKEKNSVVIESSILESKTSGLKGFLKSVFNHRMSKAYCSGKSQERLARMIGFKGRTVITKGVGVFNYRKQPAYVPRTSVMNFVFVGRLVKEKNLKWLFSQFNRHPEFHLDIIGFGKQEDELKTISKDNIRFLGAVDNQQLSQYYQQADVFILPSISEPWGLVVEEALNNGLPVMVSDRVGCAEEIVNNRNGVIFQLTEEDFDKKLLEITNLERYNQMREYISKMDFEKIEHQQVECYV